MKTIKAKLYSELETAATRKPVSARKSVIQSKRKAIKPKSSATRADDAAPNENLLAALSALAWFKVNPRGNVGDDKALALRTLLTSAKGGIAAKGVKEWNAINRVLMGEKVKKNELHVAVDAWLRKDQTAETTTLEALYTGLKGKNSVNKKRIVENFGALYNAETKADAASALKSGWQPDTGGVKTLWEQGDFGAQSGKSVSTKTQRRTRKPGTDMRAVIKTLLEEEKSKDIDDDRRKKVAAKLMRTVKDYIEESVLSTDAKRLKTVGEVNAVAKTLIKRPLLNDKLEEFGGYIGLCRSNPKTKKATACWFNSEKKATNATWQLMTPDREITRPSKQNAIVQFYSKPAAYPTATRVLALGHLRDVDSSKGRKVEKFVTDLPRLRRKWRAALISNDMEAKNAGAVMELLYQTGHRIGTKINAKNNSYGVGTLKAEHILKINGSGTKPTFEEAQTLAHEDEIKSISLRFRGKNRHLYSFDVNPTMYAGEDKRAVEKVVDILAET